MLKLPDIHAFVSFQEFFREFMRLNDGNMSFRSFAQALNWPPALLSDLVHGHRGLSIARAVEFGTYFNMTSVEIERLVMFSLADSPNPVLKDFVDGYLAVEGRQFPDPSLAPVAESAAAATATPDYIADPDLSSLHLFLVWTNGKTTAEEIGELLLLSPALKNPQVLAEKLQILRDRGLISGELPSITVLKQSVISGGMTREQYFLTLDMLRPLSDRPEQKNHWRMSRLTIARADYPEFCQRVNNFWNWIQNQALMDNPQPGRRTDYVMLQLNFMATHLLDLSKLGLELKRSPDHKHTIEFPMELASGHRPPDE